jgi:hypothetical protein
VVIVVELVLHLEDALDLSVPHSLPYFLFSSRFLTIFCAEVTESRCTDDILLYLAFCLPVLDTLGQIGQLVTGLDVRTMAEQWKGYARLAFQYVEHLKPHLDVAGPLRFLAADVSCGLKTVIEMVSTVLTL